MSKYTVGINETLFKQFEIEASSQEEAERIAEDMYQSGEVILTADDFVEYYMTVSEKEREVSKSMNFEEFKDWAKDNIKFFLPDDWQNAKVDITDVVKAGMSYTAMTVRNDGQTSAPAINLDVMFEAYNQGSPLYEIGKNMAEIAKMEQPQFNTDLFNDYEAIKKNLFVRVCNAEENKEMLKNVPHTIKEDLAITYHIMVDKGENGLASAIINNDLLNSLGVSKEQLHEDAMKNSQDILPVRMDSMMNMLMSMSGAEMELSDIEYGMEMMRQPSMMVITNQMGLNGASALFYPETMDKVSEQLGGNVFILPSSIHEVIAVPESMDTNYRDLEDMVKQINHMQVAKEDQLSDHVYHYDTKEKTFELASKHDERLHGNEKQSLLGKLSEKKKEAAVLNDAAPAKHKMNERMM